jgi:aspartyl-tRNA synthetase
MAPMIPPPALVWDWKEMMMYLTGLRNIRDAIPFPRTPDNVDF